MDSTPEIQSMRLQMWKRIVAMGSLGLLTLVVAMHRMGLGISIDGTMGTIITLAAVVGTIVLFTDRTSWLPFLGYTVLPPSALAEKVPTDAAFSVRVVVPKGATHVMYWASESTSGVAPTPGDAYGNFTNTGVVKAGSDGVTSLKVRCPGQYKVRGRALPRHVHYRAIFPSGIAGPVQTSTVTCL